MYSCSYFTVKTSLLQGGANKSMIQLQVRDVASENLTYYMLHFLHAHIFPHEMSPQIICDTPDIFLPS